MGYFRKCNIFNSRNRPHIENHLVFKIRFGENMLYREIIFQKPIIAQRESTKKGNQTTTWCQIELTFSCLDPSCPLSLVVLCLECCIFLYFQSGPSVEVSVTRTEFCYKNMLVMLLPVDSDTQGWDDEKWNREISGIFSIIPMWLFMWRISFEA